MNQLRRRHVVAAGLALAAAAIVRPAFADANPAVARAIGWLLGDNLSLGALVYAQGAAAADVATYIDKARGLGANIGLTVPDLPALEADETATLSAVIHYLIAGDGWHLGDFLLQSQGQEATTLFEVAIKSNVLILLYEPGNDSGIGEIIRSRLDGLLPRDLWGPVVDAVTSKKSADDVQTAIYKMHDDIGQYLIKAMG